jgi:outer membrane PBP1 activator LpoA protein
MGARHQQTPLRSATLLAAVLIMTVAACTPQLGTRREEPGARVAEAQQAWQLKQQGDAAGAARAFLAAADKSRQPQSQTLRLHAAQTLVEAGDNAGAAAIIDRTSIPGDQGDLRAWARILSAQVALGGDQFDRAFADLDQAQEIDRGAARRRQIHEVRAQVFERAGQPLAAASERLLLEPMLAEIHEVDDNRAVIWALVQKPETPALEAQLPAATPALRGWMQLALITRRAASHPGSFATAVAQWQRDFPDHAGNSVFATGALAAPAPGAAMPATLRRLALLLPSDPPYAEAGNAVRDGFISAWYQAGSTAGRPAVAIYQANPASVSTTYDAAVAAGAEMVIGPLEKPAAEVLAQRTDLTAPVLALNQISGTAASPAMIQFGLPPEDEARQVAERAWFDGHQRALILSPADTWGGRVTEAFRTHWQAMGGEVVEVSTYAPDTKDFAAPIKLLLNIDESEARVAELRKTVGRDLQTEPRRRQDADMLFLAAFPLQARQLRPQLQFFRAETLPVYATSHVYVGAPDSHRDVDLDGIAFADMPWILNEGIVPGSVRDIVQRHWPEEAATYGRLYALGADAYRLLSNLDRLRGEPGYRLDGDTGVLLMNDRGQILRQLTWARFTGGIPTPIDGVAARVNEVAAPATSTPDGTGGL